MGSFYTLDSGTYYINFVACASEDSGSTWNSDLFNLALNSGSYLDGAIHRGYYDSAATRFVFPTTYETAGGGGHLTIGMVRYSLSTNNITGVGELTGNYPKNINSIYTGNWIDDDTLYYFVYLDDSDDYRLMSFLGSFSTVETLTGITAPASYNAQAQLYWRQGNSEWIMDEDHFYVRELGETTWSSYVDTGTTTNAIVYDYDSDGFYQITFIVWKDTIYKINAQGLPVKLQLTAPRDFKTVWPTGEDVTGVVQWGTAANPSLGDWTDTSGADCTVSIVAEVDGHKNVLQLNDQSASAACDIVLPFTDQLTGNIELWIRSSDITLRGSWIIDGVGGIAVAIRIDESKIQYFDGAVKTDIQAAANDTWYHISIKNLSVSTDTYDLWLNGVEIATDIDFINTCTSIDDLNIFTTAVNSNYILSTDAIGFSWDDYVADTTRDIDAYVGWGSALGDAWFADGIDRIYQYTLAADTTFQKAEINTALYLPPKADLIGLTAPFQDQYLMLYDDRDTLLYEGFVQSYEYNTEQYRYIMQSGADIDYKEKVDASYTAQTAHAILKDIIDNNCKFLHYTSTSISTTPSTTYTISFKGKTVLDVMRWVDNQEGYITSVRPDLTVHWDQFVDGFVGEDHKYGVTGVVQWGTWLNPSLGDFTIVEGTGGTTEIIAELDGHKNILQQYRGTGTPLITLPFTQQTGDGVIIEFFWRQDISSQDIISIRGDSNSKAGPHIYQNSGNWAYYLQGTGTTNLVGKTYVVNVWYHHKLICSQTANTFDWYVDGVSIGADLTYREVVATGIDTFTLTSFGDTTSTFLDTLGGSMFGQGTYVADTNQYKTVNDQTESGITFTPTLKSTATKYSRIVVWGGYVNGVQLKSTVLGEPNYGTWQDWFPEITDQTTLDALATQEAADKNVVIQKMKLGVRTTGQFNVGTSFQNNISQYSISDDTWYVLSVKYDAIINESKFVAADSYLSPSPQENERVAVQQNTRLTKQNEQNVGALESKTTWTPRDPTAWDFAKTDLDDDTSSHDLDLSSIVGAKKVMVKIRLQLQDGAAGSAVIIRDGDHVNDYSAGYYLTQVANIVINYYGEFETASDGTLRIQCVPKPTDWSNLNIVVIRDHDA